jgi:hypothetical protein
MKNNERAAMLSDNGSSTDEEYSYGEYDDNGITITGYNGSASEITIPEK